MDDRSATGRTVDGSTIADYLLSVDTDSAGLSTPRSAPSPSADAAELMDRLRSAEDEVTQLSQALESQRLIGVAIGMLAHRFGCSPEQSWRLLVRLSQNSNVKVRDIARILVDAHSGRSSAADAEALAVLAAQLPPDDGGPRDAPTAHGSRRSPTDNS